jgi:hypothetical protein
MTDIGSGVLLNASTTGSGTGNYDSFLRLNATGTESGINSDTNNLLDNKNGIWTHSLQVGDLQVTNIGGIDYYEIRLDLNEIQSGDSPNITLLDLRFFTSTAPADGGDLPSSFGDLTQVFDMSGTQALIDTNHGSGTDDYTILIPVSLLGNDPAAYFTLYAQFSGADDGFEEFRALTTEFNPQPDIGINKETNGTDDTCGNILAGQTVTWTYTVENNGNLGLSNVVVTDDNGTPLDTSDDFHPVLVSGDTDNDGILDTTETWIFSATGTAGIGEYTNIATVTGDWSFGQSSGSVNSSESDCYFGANPALDIVKLTNGTDNLCPVLAVGESVTWTYNVTNSGNIGFAAADITITDDNGTPGANSPESDDDFSPTAVLSSGFNVGDIDQDNILDPGETWQYTATGTVQAGEYENTATVSVDFTDDSDNSTTVTDSESDCYTGVEGCVRTPGFWQNPNNGGQFWDGAVGNEKNFGQEHFPTADLLYSVDSDNNGSLDGKVGLLIGDWNMDGLTDPDGADNILGTNDDEDTIFISLSNALALVNANNKQMSDGVVKIGRDVVASWLNYLSGAGVGTFDSGDGAYSPKEAIRDAINYLQIFGDSNNSNAASTETFDTYSSSHHKVDTSSAFWNNDYPGGSVSGATIHSDLDGYNNTGTIDGIAYASSCDSPQLLEELTGFSVNGSLSLNTMSII